MPLWLRVWNEDDLGPIMDTLRRLMLDRTIENVPQIWNTIAMASVLSSRAPWYQGEDPIPDDVIDHMARELEIGRWTDALRPLRRRGGRRPPIREGQGGVRARSPAPRSGGRSTPRGLRHARASVRPRPGRRPEPRHQPDDRLVRRRGGRPHRLLPGRPPHGPGRDGGARPAPRPRRAGGEARLRGRADPDQLAQLHPRDDGHLRHEGRGRRRGAPTTRRSCS